MITDGNIKETKYKPKDIIILSLLVGIIIESSVLYNTFSNLDASRQNVNSIENELDELEELYSEAIVNNTLLQINNDELAADYCDLQVDYNKLEYENDLMKVMQIDNSLASYYDELRIDKGPTGTWISSDQSTWQDAANFAALLGLHDLSEIYWPYLENDYYTSTNTYSYTTAKAILDDLLELLDISLSTPTIEKVEKILLFCSTHIEYRPEINDIFHSPVETLNYKSGDCDDFAILASTLFELVGIDTAMGLFYNETRGGHAMVLVKLDTLAPYSSWYYPDLTSLGLESGIWLKIEPQIRIEYQGAANQKDWGLIKCSPLDASYHTSS